MKKRDRLSATIWFLMIPFVALMMRLASTASADVSYAVLAGYALLGRGQAIQALFLSWLFSMLSPGLAPESSFAMIGRYLVMLAAALSVLFQWSKLKSTLRVGGPVMATVLFGVFLVLHSLLFSPNVDVSILKSVNFILVLSTLLAAWGGLPPDERQRTERFVFGGLIAILLVSLPLMATGLGYLRNGTGFQGILNQPQAFGPTIALLGAWWGSRYLSDRHLPRWYLAILGACLVSVVLTEARTAAAALVLGVALPLVAIIVYKRPQIGSILPGLRSNRIVFVGVIAVLGMSFAGARLTAEFESFLTKSGRSEVSGVLEAFEDSRGQLVYTMLDNIESNPGTGIGFGIGSLPSLMIVKREPYFGLPISAGIEKGVMPIAVMEELGILGFVLLAALLWTLIRRAARGGFAPLVVITTALLTNLGENMLFSPGGMGLLLLILVGWAATSRQPEVRYRTRYG